MMGSRQLEYFRAVARELHFTRAAEALRIAQPALSQQIRKLERQLGVALFERNNHRVELTPAGTALLEHAERILADMAAVEDEMRGWAEGTRGRIRLGGARGLTARLARLLAEFSRQYPAIVVELLEMNTEEMVAGLYGGRLDAATVVRLPPQEEGRRLESLPLGEEPLVLVTTPSGPLAGKYRVPVASLDGVDLVCYPPGSVIREIVLSALADAGATPHIRFETREYSTARAMVSVGLAAAVMPRSVAEEPGQPVGVVRLDPEPTWAPSLAWPAGRRPGPALAAFIDFMARHPGLAS
ncbi:LysR family transcriptional regulator [Actinomadura syzygii]|uniref:LysR family transcriptional regulator n=1 Tax=Actinomadura syzygii TaxID=1427538 RepID=A0A5D0TU37_9ACTN|nr:LysR family transcriptional regulator [Actinomadura syzygii]TYC08349.1 LysR family transcriptional regulator [Actinomadura syzygii]